MDLISFIKNYLPSDYDLRLTNELSFSFDRTMDNVIVRIQQGNRYKRGVVMPLTIMVTSKDINRASSVWNQFVKTVSDNDYIEGTSNYYMLFMIPTVTQVFDEISNNYYSVLSIMGTIVETDASNDISKIEIKNTLGVYEELELISGSVSYVSTPKTEQEANGYMMKTNIQGSVLSANIVTHIDDNDFFTRLRLMRQGGNNNQTFETRITWLNGDIENYNFKLTRQAFLKNRGELSSLTIDFML